MGYAQGVGRGAIRIGGVEHTRADGPVDFWFVIAVMVDGITLLRRPCAEKNRCLTSH